MRDYGAAPEAHEIEVTVFGPGYGEAIAVHLGSGQWMLVDSCEPLDTKIPASLEYLCAIGAPADAVRVIVASHWHDDHVRGLSKLLDAYPQADLFISSVFSDREALAFVEGNGGPIAPSLTRGTKELAAAIGKTRNFYFADQRTIVFEETLCGRSVRVLALAPNAAAQAVALTHFATYVPIANAPVMHAPELKPNIEAIVLHVEFGEEAVLLGSDLEDYPQCGWAALVSNAWCLQRRRASAYKVAHHGSKTGNHVGIWSHLVQQQPVAVLTPFVKGSVSLPTADDRTRVRSDAEAVYITSTSSRRARIATDQLRRMRAIADKITPVNSGFGAVRLRKQHGSAGWRVELFEDARML
ncbi:MAG TPA: MBL fold metallo-hydrolase [Burkholderiales bacterium]|nr:MBL fold metallo-hydrolase [Burkholderiales bacterium]